MRSIGDFFISFVVYFKVKWFLYKEKREVHRRFPTFLRFENALNRAYRFHNPFRICKEFLRRNGDQFPDAYGETPIPVLAKIAQECNLNSEDVFFDLGCGRGRGAIFLSQLIGCRTVGIDWIPFFIQTAQNIITSFSPRLSTHFRCSNILAADLSEATVIFLYGTCLSDEVIRSLISRFEKLSLQTKVITVSYPLRDYNPRFHIQKQFTALFPWGKGEIYINSLLEKL
jgi:SAM-dependent methyltransferase